MRRSGSAIRSIGRRNNEESPVSNAGTLRPASSPVNIRIVDPELPQSSGSAGSIHGWGTLHQDKSQFFIDTKVKFLIEKDPSLLDFKRLSNSNNINPFEIISETYESEEYVVADNAHQVVNSGKFQGVNFVGDFFWAWNISI